MTIPKEATELAFASKENGFDPFDCGLENGGQPFVYTTVRGTYFVVRQVFTDPTHAIFSQSHICTEILCSPSGYETYDEAESALLKAYPWT